MIKILGQPLRISLTKLDELQLCDPNAVDGWNVTHLSSTKVCYNSILHNYINP